MPLNATSLCACFVASQPPTQPGRVAFKYFASVLRCPALAGAGTAACIALRLVHLHVTATGTSELRGSCCSA